MMSDARAMQRKVSPQGAPFIVHLNFDVLFELVCSKLVKVRERDGSTKPRLPFRFHPCYLRSLCQSVSPSVYTGCGEESYHFFFTVAVCSVPENARG
jgi:hypothetical protein